MLDTQTDKNGQLLHQLALRYNVTLPAFVKEATITGVATSSTTPTSLFADPIARAFPCHTKEATFLSSVYLFGQHADGVSYPKRGVGVDIAADKLLKAATYWGVRHDVDLLRDNIQKVASARAEVKDTDFALVVDYAGQRTRQFPIRTPELLQKSASDLYARRHQIPYIWRKQASANLLNRAMREGIDIADTDAYFYLVKASGVSPRDHAEAGRDLLTYAYTFENNEQRTHIQKAAGILSMNEAVDVEGLCTCLDMINRQGRYERDVPEEILFAGPPVKEAGLGAGITFQNGKTYPADAIKKAGLNPILAVCGDDVAGAISDVTGDFDIEKAAEVLPTLPRNMADSLCALYERQNGIKPADPIEKSAMVGRRKKKGACSKSEKYVNVNEWRKMAEDMNLTVTENPCWTMTMTLK